MESLAVRLTHLDRAVGMDARHEYARAGSEPVGLLLAPVRRVGRLRLGVFPVALVSPQGTLPVQARTRLASPVPRAAQLGDSVPTPLGADQRWHLHYHVAVVVHWAPNDALELHAVQHHSERRGAYRLRFATNASPLGAVLGRFHKTRHASPETAHQLPAVLQLVGPSVRLRVSRPAGWRLQTDETTGLGGERTRVAYQTPRCKVENAVKPSRTKRFDFYPSLHQYKRLLWTWCVYVLFLDQTCVNNSL